MKAILFLVIFSNKVSFERETIKILIIKICYFKGSKQNIFWARFVEKNQGILPSSFDNSRKRQIVLYKEILMVILFEGHPPFGPKTSASLTLKEKIKITYFIDAETSNTKNKIFGF